MTLEEIRQFYSEEVRMAAPLRSAAVAEAFARVHREEFLGPGPWRIALADVGRGASYLTTDDADPRHVYHNVSIALDPSRHLINGQPATLGRWIDELGVRAGDRVFHLGCGTGYYTAILAELAGAGGHVAASEIDASLAEQARENLAKYANVMLCSGDGAAVDPGTCDAILINAGVTHAKPEWLDRLGEGGRMILPLTVAMGPNLGKGVVLKIVRAGTQFTAQMLGFAVIYNCSGVRDPEIERVLGKSLASGALLKATSVRRDAHTEDATCAVHSSTLCLSLRAVH